jgi:hypothetical protein
MTDWACAVKHKAFSVVVRFEINLIFGDVLPVLGFS